MLFKKNDRTDPRNYRPITLLNTDYKIFTRILSKRMATVLHEFVSECQKEFVPDTFIAEASMLLRMVEAYINEEPDKRKGAYIFLDMEKAFDAKVMLNLWVKVKTGWADDERALHSLGYYQD